MRQCIKTHITCNIQPLSSEKNSIPLVKLLCHPLSDNIENLNFESDQTIFQIQVNCHHFGVAMMGNVTFFDKFLTHLQF